MVFARHITAEEIALGFECAEHVVHGPMVTARIGIGIRAVKVIQRDHVEYVICDDQFIVLYPRARSLADLRLRFGLGDRMAG